MRLMGFRFFFIAHILLKVLSIVASSINATKIRIKLPPTVSCDAFVENIYIYCSIVWPNSGTKLTKMKFWIVAENS